MSNQPEFRIACDSLVALGAATRDGRVHFAKNSDRPANECQPLTLVPAGEHARTDVLRCTYVEIPQAPRTARVLGSRPYWCWGFEHGLNEHGVAIGNHTVFTKDPVSGLGLIGMDLVRLGLERSVDARSALSTITSLLGTYGQGGSGYADKDWPYHNSFLIADRTSAFVLETSDRHWATRRVQDVASLTNHLTLGGDWQELSEQAVAHARAQGWWERGQDVRFDFAAAYRDTSMAPESISSGRYARTCARLAEGHGKIDVTTLRSVLRDHYGSAMPRRDLMPDDPEYFSVCMHADPVGTTTASMIAPLPRDATAPLLTWVGLGSPCVGVFLPLFVDVDLPESLGVGGESFDPDSAWWRFKRLLAYVEADWTGRFAHVRETLDAWEAEIGARLEVDRIFAQPASRRNAFCLEAARSALELIRDWIS